MSIRNFLIEQGHKEEDIKKALEIKPLILEELYKKNEYTVFNTIRDNKGKGIKAKDLIKVLRNKTTYKKL